VRTAFSRPIHHKTRPQGRLVGMGIKLALLAFSDVHGTVSFPDMQKNETVTKFETSPGADKIPRMRAIINKKGVPDAMMASFSRDSDRTTMLPRSKRGLSTLDALTLFGFGKWQTS
jgi:hypothetical protein